MGSGLGWGGAAGVLQLATSLAIRSPSHSGYPITLHSHTAWTELRFRHETKRALVQRLTTVSTPPDARSRLPANPDECVDAAAVSARPAPQASVSALPFRLRTLNVLRGAGVETVEALCRMTPVDLTHRGLSEAVAREVAEVLAAQGLALGAPRDDGETPVETLALSAHAEGALRAAGVQTVETLCWLTAVDLSRVRHLGPERALEVSAALAARGFALRAGGRASRADRKGPELLRALTQAQEDADAAPFPTPADVEAVLAAAGRDGVAHTAAGERLRYIARRLAGLVPPKPGVAPDGAAGRHTPR